MDARFGLALLGFCRALREGNKKRKGILGVR